jgi:hypothetical protein
MCNAVWRCTNFVPQRCLRLSLFSTSLDLSVEHGPIETHKFHSMIVWVVVRGPGVRHLRSEAFRINA